MELKGSLSYYKGILAFFIFIEGLLFFWQKITIPHIYSSLTMNDINVDPNESDTNKSITFNKDEVLYACLNELSSRGNMDSIAPSGLKNLDRQNQSLCSDGASERGPHQHVVSFSFYGRINAERNYFQGIEENAKLMGKIYPKWIMRLYHDIPPLSQNLSVSKNISDEFQRASSSNASTLQGLISSPQVKLCILEHIYPNIDLCYVGKISGYGKLLGSQGNMWRFLPMADPLVDVFVSRDLDSRLNGRERAAVDDWLSSNLTFHFMRDHPFHDDYILAGMWGAVTFRDRERLRNLTHRLMYKGRKALQKNLDQILLNQVIWPVAKGTSKQHDSYYCGAFKEHGNMTPWPTQRSKEPYNFVGSRMVIDIKPLREICPVKCRPRNRRYWIFC